MDIAPIILDGDNDAAFAVLEALAALRERLDGEDARRVRQSPKARGGPRIDRGHSDSRVSGHAR